MLLTSRVLNSHILVITETVIVNLAIHGIDNYIKIYVSWKYLRISIFPFAKHSPFKSKEFQNTNQF